MSGEITEALIKEYFPEATDISIEGGSAQFYVGEAEYSLEENPAFSVYMSAGNEDGAAHAGTAEEALGAAAEEDWDDHGFMLQISIRPKETT